MERRRALKARAPVAWVVLFSVGAIRPPCTSALEHNLEELKASGGGWVDPWDMGEAAALEEVPLLELQPDTCAIGEWTLRVHGQPIVVQYVY